MSPRPPERELTGTEALARAGYAHRRPEGAEPGSPAAAAHEIVAPCGAIVARLKAHEVWAWLNEAPVGATCSDPVCAECEDRRLALGVPSLRDPGGES